MIKLFFNNVQVPYELIKFPAGETHIRVTAPYDKISLFFESNDDIINALFLLNKNKHAELYIPYFPYGRQDREITTGDVLSLEVIGSLFKHYKLTLLDPHSYKTLEALNNANWTELSQLSLFMSVYNPHLYKDVVILAPDKGAADKARFIAEALNTKFYQATKERDPNTGRLTKFLVPNIKEHSILIVDDICDGGGTFLGIADQLPNKMLHLWTTHGIYSKGTDILLEKFQTVFCYNHVATGQQQFYTRGTMH